MPATTASSSFETDIPNRLDRLPFTRFHWLVIVALGITWIIDGLEVTLVGSLSSTIAATPSMHMSDREIGLAASAYLVGAAAGALFFGWLTDRLGRKKLFTVTLLIYVIATIASGLSWNFWLFLACRLITGAGIGGEYAAINATIQELIPARRRGFTDLLINGSFWLGAALGSAGSVVVLDFGHPEAGWRLAFMIGGAIGFVILFLRRFIPESPRWLMTHGQPEEAERVTHGLEQRIEQESGAPLPAPEPGSLRLRTDVRSWFVPGIVALFGTYRRRTVLGVALMAAQAFCYNAVLFTYALILTGFYKIPAGRVGLFMLPFALGNFAGPLILGRLFDTLGRRPMIIGTYALAGLLMIGTGWLFVQGRLDASQQTWAWTLVFFFASAAASSAYLTVGENFPLEVRAIAIALFYALGTAIGGVAGPVLFGALIQTGDRFMLFWGYALGGTMMIGAAAVAGWLLVPSERRSLEDISPPLSAVPAT